jgi:hypothetical protein
VVCRGTSEFPARMSGAAADPVARDHPPGRRVAGFGSPGAERARMHSAHFPNDTHDWLCDFLSR